MVGSRILHYEILRKLGEGGMGEVYLAHDTKLARKVAIKILPSRFSASAEALDRFEREARAAAALQHPNIVTIHEFVHHDGLRAIVMAYVEGELLSDVIARGPMPLSRCLDVALALCDALGAAHAAGIVHRDLKPGNIMIDTRGNPRVLDFGLAIEADATRFTREGATIGTLHYMSPEQARGEMVDARSDIFSLGVILYEMITSRRAFPGDSLPAIYHQVTASEPQPLSRHSGEATPELERIVRTAMAKQREQRYQTASDLAAALRQFRQGSAPVVSAPGRPAKRRSLSAPLALALVILLAAAGIFGLLRRRGGTAGDVSPGEIRTLAVLPFEGTSSDAEGSYFADGMTDALIQELGQIAALNVVARGSSREYGGSTLPRPDIAAALGADVLVEGSVLLAGEKARINVELVRASGQRLWGDSYESELGDVLGLQARVAREIAGQIRVNLAPFEEQRFRQKRTVQPDALRAYLRGRYHMNLQTMEGVQEAFLHFERAIRDDPSFVDAYVGLADAYFWKGYFSKDPGHDWLKAEEFTARALQMDGALPEAFTIRAQIQLARDWDLAAARAELQRARELNPNTPLVHSELSTVYLVTGALTEGVAEHRSAVALNPLDHGLNCSLTRKLITARRYDEAIDHGSRTAESFPTCPYDPLFVAEALLLANRLDEAIEHLETSLAVAVTARALACLAIAQERAGRPDAAQAARERLPNSPDYDPYFEAMVQAGLGDADRALAALEAAYQMRSRHLVWLRVEPMFDSLQADPRMRDLEDRVGLWRS